MKRFIIILTLTFITSLSFAYSKVYDDPAKWENEYQQTMRKNAPGTPQEPPKEDPEDEDPTTPQGSAPVGAMALPILAGCLVYGAYALRKSKS